MLTRRDVLWAASAGLVASLLPGTASASVFRSLTLNQLVDASHHVVVAEALEGYGEWENIAGRRRIVTYTRVGVRERVHGSGKLDSELLVRTLGGRVGDIGQLVHGEAVLALGAPSVVFLRRREDGALGVSAMAQGHYPLVDSAGSLRLGRSPRLGELTGDEAASAVRRLVGRTVPEATRLVREAIRR